MATPNPSVPRPARASLPDPLRPLRPRKKRGNEEFIAQCDLFDFLRYWTYREPRFAWIHPSLNGVHLSDAQAAKAKRTGMLAGVWDVETPFDGRWEGEVRSALHIEMKSATGRLTEEQEAFRAALQEERAFVVCTDWIAAARAICVFLNVQDEAVWAAIQVNEKGPRMSQPRRPAAAAKGETP